MAAAVDVGGNLSSSLPRDLNPEAVFCSQDGGGLPPSGGPFFHPAAAMAPVANFYGSKSKSSKGAKDPATPPPSVCSSRASPILNDMARNDLSTGEVSFEIHI